MIVAALEGDTVQHGRLKDRAAEVFHNRRFLAGCFPLPFLNSRAVWIGAEESVASVWFDSFFKNM